MLWEVIVYGSIGIFGIVLFVYAGRESFKRRDKRIKSFAERHPRNDIK